MKAKMNKGDGWRALEGLYLCDDGGPGTPRQQQLPKVKSEKPRQSSEQTATLKTGLAVALHRATTHRIKPTVSAQKESRDRTMLLNKNTRNN